MPSPANPRRSSFRGEGAKSTPNKGPSLDLGPQHGPYDTNSVRAKIRKWQQQGGGVVTANDAACYGDENDRTTSRTKPSSEKENLGSKRRNRGAGVRKRSSSTPRKRVISDEHWRISRSTTKSPAPRRPSPNKISVYTSNDELLSPPRGQKGGAQKSGSPRTARSPRSAERIRAGRTSPRSPRSKFPRTINEETEDEDMSQSTATGKPRTSEKVEGNGDMGRSVASFEEDGSATSEADFLELSKKRQRGVSNKMRGPVQPPRGGIFAHMFGESKATEKSEPPKSAGPQREGRIETWLSDAFDPFSGDNELSAEIPAPLNPKSTNLKQSQKPESSRERIPHSAPSPDDHSKRRRSNSQHTRDKEQPTVQRREQSRDEKRTSREDRKQSLSSTERNPTQYEDSAPSTDARETSDVHDQEHHAAFDTETHTVSDVSEVSGNNTPVPLSRKRPIPSTGVHQLSTIPSIDTLTSGDCGQSQPPPPETLSEVHDSTINETASDIPEEERDNFDPDSLSRVSSKLKRKMATHDDLMSVLSEPVSRSKSIRSARSVRTNRTRLGASTMTDLLQELSTEEVKYMRELKTLVGGVIPVLLTCVLSRSDSAIAAGLFRPSADPKDDVNFTKPIVDMGITLERLKTLHKRIPQEDADSLLHWAQGAQRVYRDYLKAWRLGFKDVIVNLAPQEEGEEGGDNSETTSLDEGMGRDENGDIVGSDGEKVDVAYLLKRPLVRLKYLSKSFKGINTLQPSEKAEEIATAYQDLVAEARRRAREERARLEDESAASIDATRARDPMTMAVLTDVTVDKTRRVRARDFFNLSLYHSSGQVVDCRAELLYRDNIPENGPGGDLLICEIDHADRWLLFPPIDLGCVSARYGDTRKEIIVMLRSSPGQERQWQELLSLQIDEEGIGSEWLQMLGSTPTPPQICRSQSFLNRAKQRPREEATTYNRDDDLRNQKFFANPSDVDVPMGEKKASSSGPAKIAPASITQFSQRSSTNGSSSVAGSRDSLQTAITRPSDYAHGSSDSSAKPSRPPLPSVMSAQSQEEDKGPSLKRSKAKRISRLAEFSSPQEQTSPYPIVPDDKGKAPPSPTSQRFYNKPQNFGQQPAPSPRNKTPPKEHRVSKPVDNAFSRPPLRISSVPSMELPVIPKLRSGNTSPSLPPESPSDASAEDDDLDYAFDDYDLDDLEEAPAPPPHRSPSSAGQNHLDVPNGGGQIKRHGSSPLKHEYEPSTASDSYSSDGSTVRRYSLDGSSTYSTTSCDSETESEFESDYDDIGAPSNAGTSASSLPPAKSMPPNAYRTVPIQPSKSSKAVASVFAWSDAGTWMNLCPGECSIVVSPGLIEAYETELNPNSVKDNRNQVLVGLELTPLVPIRRGTAIDISIRSPPTQRSKFYSSNNIMFRSRNAEECDDLYCLINEARINNPTYIALQNARGPFDDERSTFEASDNTSTGLFGWPRRRKSYRASANTPRSTANASESSVGTMSSAFSALKRFGAGNNKVFSIARSTITSKNGDKAGSMYSGSGGSGSTPSSGIGRIAAAIRGADGVGLSDAKIRLYTRESHSKWRDMGAARLTILPAPTNVSSPDLPQPGTAASGRGDAVSEPKTAFGTFTPRHEGEPIKRIIIRGKTRGELLLDKCLGESSFERTARTGIAVSVWEENEGGAPAKQQGGVTVGAYKIYMIQMKSEAEAAYTFGLVGKMKY